MKLSLGGMLLCTWAVLQIGRGVGAEGGLKAESRGYADVYLGRGKDFVLLLSERATAGADDLCLCQAKPGPAPAAAAHPSWWVCFVTATCLHCRSYMPAS